MGFFQEVASNYFKWSPNNWWGDYIDARFWLVKEASSLTGRVLDIGCGEGFIISHAENAKIYGIDINPKFVQQATMRIPHGRFQIGSFYQMPYHDESFDAVLLGNVILAGERVKLFKEVNRVLKKEGKLLFTAPNAEHPIHVHPNWIGRVSKTQLEEMFHSIGCQGEVLFWNNIPSVIHFLPYSMLIKIPKSCWKWLHIPSKILSYVPGMFNYLERHSEGNPRRFRYLYGCFTKPVK